MSEGVPTIAFVGAGPTTIYTLWSLVNEARHPFAATIFEEQGQPGLGTPYRPGWNDPAMLSNIASIEIPPIEETLIAWLGRQPPGRMATFGIEPAEIDDHAFYPRLVLGSYFLDQFHALIDRARSAGHSIDIHPRSRVLDVVVGDKDLLLTIKPRHGAAFEQHFDHVVLATGHQWPEEPEVRPGYFLSPWPATALARIPACKVGIRGSSLTAIDAAVALAGRHGTFVEGEDKAIAYQPAGNTDAFHMTMMSRKGLLPEADFYHPVPYEPLTICTPDAIERLIDDPAGDLLDRAFALFKQELAAADPHYASDIGLEGLDLEAFGERFFADRMAADPFEWAADNLAEAERNFEAHVTVPWRYAILRMHEVMALLVPHLEADAFQRFSRSFKPVFVDDYATVPHVSIRRMLALHEAGRLNILAIGDDYRIDTHPPGGGAVLRVAGERIAFPAFVEATGQRALPAKDFPFPSLRTQGFVRDTAAGGGKPGSRGIVVDDAFHPVSDDAAARRIYCLSLPFLLGRHPFIQGITSSHEMGAVVGAELSQAIGSDRARGDVARVTGGGPAPCRVDASSGYQRETTPETGGC